MNFVGASAHAPSARFSGKYSAGVDSGTGLHYGLLVDDHTDITNNDYAYNDYHQDIKQDYGVEDMRFLMGQIEQSFYAEFTNTVGQTEVMLIWCCGSGMINYNAKSAFNNRTLVHHQKYFCTEKINAGYTAAEEMNRDINPGMVIMRRDILNQYAGMPLPAFEGNGDTTNPAVYNSVVRRDIALPFEKSFFRIIDSLSNTEHKIVFNDADKDIVSLTGEDSTSSYAYKNLIANPVDTARATSGQGQTRYIGGGDFGLTSDPQMPYLDGTRPVYDDFSIALFKSNVLLGDGETAPTGLKPQTPGHTGNKSWQIHYDYVDVDVKRDDADVYFSTSDVATKITNQLREPKDLYNHKGGGNKDVGGTLANTAGKYPCNSLFRPILGPSSVANNQEGSEGCLTGQYLSLIHI